MPPRRGETADQKARRYNQEAAKFRSKATFQRVLKVLKTRQDVLPDVERQLIDLGVLEPTTDTIVAAGYTTPKKEVNNGVGPGAANSTKQEPQEDEDDAQLTDDDSGEGTTPAVKANPETPADDTAEVWDRNVTKYGQVHVGLLKRALQAAERSTFSQGNLKSVTKRGAREPPLTFMSQCFELVTNMDPQVTIEPRYRTPEAFVKLAEDLNKENGRRARDLVLQDALTDWAPQGVYALERASANRLKVSNRFKSLVATIQVDKEGDYYVDSNFSEMRAIIRDHNSEWRKPASVLFPKEVGKAVARRRPPARPKAAAKAEKAEEEEGTPAKGMAKPVSSRDAEGADPKGSKRVASDKAAAQKVAKIPRPGK